MFEKFFLIRYCAAALIALFTAMMIAGCDDSSGNNNSSLLLLAAAGSGSYIAATAYGVTETLNSNCHATNVGGGKYLLQCSSSDGDETFMVGVGNGAKGSHPLNTLVSCEYFGYQVKSIPLAIYSYYGGLWTNVVGSNDGKTIKGIFEGHACDNLGNNCINFSSGSYSVPIQ